MGVTFGTHVGIPLSEIKSIKEEIAGNWGLGENSKELISVVLVFVGKQTQ